MIATCLRHCCHKMLHSRLFAFLLSFVSITALHADEIQEDFGVCTAKLSQLAQQRGVSANLADSIVARLSHQSRVIELDRSQPEFVQTFTGYFTQRVTDWRVQRGRALLQEHKVLLQQLQQKYGIPAPYLVSFWGLETNFGSYKGKMPVLDSLATLACDKRRSAYFTEEFLVALQLMQRESLSYEDMLGSWAGAMGHTQFMPSAYWHYAVDGDGDGKVNLWQSEQDALTSAAHFLANLGWKPGFRWGREVTLPDNVDYAWMGKEGRTSMAQWQQRGLMTAYAQPLPSADIQAHLLLPAGHNGPAFLAYDNFHVILRWNNSEFYAIAVGHLADRIAGAPPLRIAPPELPSYTREQMIAMQQALNEKGFAVGKPDGIIGPATRAGIRAYQRQENLIADGFPALDVMQRLGIRL